MKTLLWWCLCGALMVAATHGAEPPVTVHLDDRKVQVHMGDVDVLTYVFRDDKVPHPYWAPVKTISGIQVSRNHPPVSGADPDDHPGMHTGIWMSFGDLNGHDYWRMKARTVHQKFNINPKVRENVASWEVVNHYLPTADVPAECEEIARHEIRRHRLGYELSLESRFRPLKDELVFGDQEEMGLGIRLQTPLAVDRKQGGRILDSEGRRNGAGVWGKTSAWCDYSGPLQDRWVGMTIFSDPSNFRASWNHARDYGLLVVNPFGRRAFTGGEPSQVRVAPGESLTLRYRILVHESDREPNFDTER